MFNAGIRFRLFLASYVPLFAMIALRFDGTFLALISSILALLSFIDAVYLLYWVPAKLAATPLTPDVVDDAGTEASGYMATYLLPFLTVNEPSARDLAAYGLFLAVAALIYTRSNMLRINPIVYILGRRITKLSIAGVTGYGISSKQLQAGATYQAVKVGGGLYIIS